MSVPPKRKLRIGVLLEAVQLSDIIGIDILGNLSQSYMSLVESIGEEWAAFAPQAIDMEFLFIANTLDPTEVTPGLRVVPTVTYDDCPRALDMVLVGGPAPTHRPEAADRFIREAWAQTRVWFTTCTGSMWLASSGVVDGLRCTTNRGMLEIARGMHPAVEWLDQRWVVEGKPFEGEGKGELWTAGGAGAGIHMMATYCLENFDNEFVEKLALQPLEFRLAGNASQFYPASG